MPVVTPGGAGLATLELEGVAETAMAASARTEKRSLSNCIVGVVGYNGDGQVKG
jgi:hypothetical protein